MGVESLMRYKRKGMNPFQVRSRIYSKIKVCGLMRVLASCARKQTLFIVHYSATVPHRNFP
jgi:hypothetical protein